MILAFAGGAALRVPVAPALKGYPLNRYLGLLPSFRGDAVGCLAAHAAYCREEGLDAVALNMGLLGRFTMVIGSEQLAAIFDDRDNIYYKSAIDRRGVGLLTGIGVLLADGEEHTRRRRLVLPSFEARRLERYMETMTTVAQQLSDELLQAADGSPSSKMPVASTMSAAALRIVGLCLFSTDPSANAGSFASALEACLEHTVWISRTALPPPRWLPTRRNRRFRRNLRTLDDFVYGLINERRRVEQSGARRAAEVIALARAAQSDARQPAEAPSRGDLLGMLLEAEVDPEDEDSSRRGGGSGGGRGAGDAAGLSAREVRDEAMTLMLAGHETSALALTWCLHYLSAEDMTGWRAAIADEGRELLRDGASPSMLEKGMPNTRAALCESLRLRPPGWAFDREVQRAVTLPGGIELRKREILLISPFTQHQDEAVFSEPERYDPTRFLNAQGTRSGAGDAWDGGFGKHEYMPFGQGRRRCIGYRFARWEMLVVLATLLAHVDISRPSGYVEPLCDGSVTLRPAAEFELTVRRREQSSK